MNRTPALGNPPPHGERNGLFGEDTALGYDRWFETPAGSLAKHLQTRLLLSLLDPQWGESALDVGCGTGEAMHVLADAGARVTGVDHSPAMLRVAAGKLSGVRLICGNACALPFPDASFDVAIMNTTLEFLPHPATALAELVRVARRRVYVGVLNRWSVLGVRRRLEAHRTPTVYRGACFYPLPELIRLLARAGTVRWRWAGVPHFPNRLCRRSVVRRLAGSVAGWPNPFASYLGCAADIERVRLIRSVPSRRFRALPAADTAIARVGIADLDVDLLSAASDYD